MATIDEAKDLKRRWHNLLDAGVSGYGITHIGGGGGDGWALKLNTRWQPKGDVPTEIDGIPVVVEHVGLVEPALTMTPLDLPYKET